MSVFQAYPSRYTRCGLSFGIELAILSQIGIEDLDELKFREIVKQSYCLVYDEAVVNKYFEEILQRVLQRIGELEEKDGKPTSPGRTGKTFGTVYSEWLGSLDPAQTCLFLADYDISKALHYYWNEDFTLVEEAVKLKISYESQKSLIQLEASMYGFGGKYSDDSGAGDPNTVNVDDINPEEIQAFMSGFGM